ncbi:hypothetical protein CDIK_0379 [Cucumispora dikerogammari]|nr:hypothetical protein CDIK_0379 [Cucumispora dikerogammari]
MYNIISSTEKHLFIGDERKILIFLINNNSEYKKSQVINLEEELKYLKYPFVCDTKSLFYLLNNSGYYKLIKLSRLTYTPLLIYNVNVDILKCNVLVDKWGDVYLFDDLNLSDTFNESECIIKLWKVFGNMCFNLDFKVLIDVDECGSISEDERISENTLLSHPTFQEPSHPLLSDTSAFNSNIHGATELSISLNTNKENPINLTSSSASSSLLPPQPASAGFRIEAEESALVELSLSVIADRKKPRTNKINKIFFQLVDKFRRLITFDLINKKLVNYKSSSCLLEFNNIFNEVKDFILTNIQENENIIRVKIYKTKIYILTLENLYIFPKQIINNNEQIQNQIQIIKKVIDFSEHFCLNKMGEVIYIQSQEIFTKVNIKYNKSLYCELNRSMKFL